MSKEAPPIDFVTLCRRFGSNLGPVSGSIRSRTRVCTQSSASGLSLGGPPQGNPGPRSSMLLRPGGVRHRSTGGDCRGCCRRSRCIGPKAPAQGEVGVLTPRRRGGDAPSWSRGAERGGVVETTRAGVSAGAPARCPDPNNPDPVRLPWCGAGEEPGCQGSRSRRPLPRARAGSRGRALLALRRRSCASSVGTCSLGRSAVARAWSSEAPRRGRPLRAPDAAAPGAGGHPTRRGCGAPDRTNQSLRSSWRPPPRSLRGPPRHAQVHPGPLSCSASSMRTRLRG